MVAERLRRAEIGSVEPTRGLIRCPSGVFVFAARKPEITETRLCFIVDAEPDGDLTGLAQARRDWRSTSGSDVI